MGKSQPRPADDHSLCRCFSIWNQFVLLRAVRRLFRMFLCLFWRKLNDPTSYAFSSPKCRESRGRQSCLLWLRSSVSCHLWVRGISVLAWLFRYLMWFGQFWPSAPTMNSYPAMIFAETSAFLHFFVSFRYRGRSGLYKCYHLWQPCHFLATCYY